MGNATAADAGRRDVDMVRGHGGGGADGRVGPRVLTPPGVLEGVDTGWDGIGGGGGRRDSSRAWEPPARRMTRSGSSMMERGSEWIGLQVMITDLITSACGSGKVDKTTRNKLKDNDIEDVLHRFVDDLFCDPGSCCCSTLFAGVEVLVSIPDAVGVGASLPGVVGVVPLGSTGDSLTASLPLVSGVPPGGTIEAFCLLEAGACTGAGGAVLVESSPVMPSKDLS